jgi:hypothetical protein
MRLLAEMHSACSAMRDRRDVLPGRDVAHTSGCPCSSAQHLDGRLTQRLGDTAGRLDAIDTTSGDGCRDYDLKDLGGEIRSQITTELDVVVVGKGGVNLDDAGVFLNKWGRKAEQLGWQAEELFGLHGEAPMSRYDFIGLVWMFRGRRVTDIDADCATLSGTLRFYRDPTRGKSRGQ